MPMKIFIGRSLLLQKRHVVNNGSVFNRFITEDCVVISSVPDPCLVANKLLQWDVPSDKKASTC